MKFNTTITIFLVVMLAWLALMVYTTMRDPCPCYTATMKRSITISYSRNSQIVWVYCDRDVAQRIARHPAVDSMRVDEPPYLAFIDWRYDVEDVVRDFYTLADCR